MPAHDEHGIRNTHLSRITYFGPVCPATVSHADGNPRPLAAIPASVVTLRSHSSRLRALPLPDPAQRRLHRCLAGILGRQVLAVAPGAARAVLMVPLAAGDADHVLYCARRPGITPCEMASAYAQRRAAGPQVFPDRAFAGLLLGGRLREVLMLTEARPPGLASQEFDAERTVLAALPRGGVAVGASVARCLNVPVEVLVTRKIGHPEQPELGLGAIAEGGEPVFDDYMLERVGLRACDLADVVARERDELARRVLVYRGGRPLPDFAGRRVIVVDDGLATGVTARAALRAVRAGGAARTVLAVPVASALSAQSLKAETDEVVTLVTPRRFRSVGEWYAEFGQLTDDDVLTLLAASR